jgi:hypothetical protein
MVRTFDHGTVESDEEMNSLLFLPLMVSLVSAASMDTFLFLVSHLSLLLFPNSRQTDMIHASPRLVTIPWTYGDRHKLQGI